MKSSKTLTSAVVAVALVGTIGLAFAQTQTDSQPINSPTPMANQPATGTMGTQPGMDTMAAPTTDTTMQNERAAQADRN